MAVVWVSLVVSLLQAVDRSNAGSRPEFLVVVNVATEVKSLEAEEISRFFLKKVTRWEDGRPVLPVDQSESSAVRVGFTRQILRRKIAAVKAYWQQRIFSGRDVPPPVRDSDEEVLRYVAGNAGAIGYVSAGSPLHGDVRVIQVNGTAP